MCRSYHLRVLGNLVDVQLHPSTDFKMKVHLWQCWSIGTKTDYYISPLHHASFNRLHNISVYRSTACLEINFIHYIGQVTQERANGKNDT